MSLRKIEADCPTCKGKVNFEVSLPDPQVRVTEDTSRIEEVTRTRDALARERDALIEQARSATRELQQWQSMEKHAPVPQILEHLATCPNCQPELQSYLDRFVSTLPPDRVREIARQQKWWPPPSIEFVTRKARA